MTIEAPRLAPMRGLRRSIVSYVCEIAVIAAISACVLPQTLEAEDLKTREALGQALFADRNLSFSRKQNCVSCHSPQLAFTDPRALGEIQGAVSRGGDGRSLGDRNSPTLAYLRLMPAFHMSPENEPVGGMFWDGRAHNIERQIRDPLLNPLEMGMPDEESVVARLRETPDYQAAFNALFGDGTLTETPKAFAALESAIAAFLLTPQFSPFDSKYDRALHGQATLSESEIRGRDLFFSKEGAGCHRCHSNKAAGADEEAFTNFSYVNLGVPENATARRLNKRDAQRVDHGLMQNAAAARPEFDGKFKVPTLRNVAITGPYMHNGVFQDLRTAILFHLRFSNPDIAKSNPETGFEWNAPEVAANIVETGRNALLLSNTDVQALIDFLKTLTDKNYEDLIAP